MMRRVSSGSRLKEYMQKTGLRQVDILRKTTPHQKKLGIKLLKTHLSNYVNGRAEIDIKKARLLAAALEINEAWLLGYDVPMKGAYTELKKDETYLLNTYRQLDEDIKDKILEIIEQEYDSQYKILRLSKKDAVTIYPSVIGAAAGVGTSHYADDDVDALVVPKDVVPISPAVVAMYVRGDSMKPKFFDGDIMWVNTGERGLTYGELGVFDYEDGRVVKKMGNGELISINHSHPNILLNEYSDFSTFGKVVDVIRREEIEAWKNAKWI